MSAKSTVHGKAFEYAVLQALHEVLEHQRKTIVQENSAFAVAKKNFESIEPELRGEFDRAAAAGIAMVIAREPRLEHSADSTDALQIALQSDQRGQLGDVRDIVISRPNIAWEIGISAKNNHKAVKSSRLAHELDFGQSWFGVPCSQEFRSAVRSVFQGLHEHAGNVRWRDLGELNIDKFAIYRDVLGCFRTELLRMNAELGAVIPSRLVRYLIGNFDFYKIVKLSQRVHVQPFNFDGTLGQRSPIRKPSPEASTLRLPTRIYDIHYVDETSNTTLIVACDAGWQISFRIHNASEFVEPSLKFDVMLAGQPPELITQEAPW